jgi:GNAT superfamily N-acetyltransferase
MNGRDLTLGLVGALALGAALGRARGSRSAAAEMGWTQEPVILLQEPIRKRGRVSGDTGLWLRAQRMDYPYGRQLAVFVLEDPDADTSMQNEGDEAVLGYVLADDAQIYSRILPACADALADLRRRGIVRGLYLVGNTELDSRLHGRGIGSAMYDALIRAAWSDRYAVSPHWCAPRGSVSDAAMRVWSTLARRYPHVGDPDYMRAEEDDHDPEALAQAGTPVIVWGGGGSTNRAPAPTDPTSTPAFRRWFGDSKVVDSEGKPLVVHHGTTAGEFDAFRPNYRKKEQLSFGIYFTEGRGMANRHEAAAPLVLYHGSQRWEGPPQIVAHRKGHAEHGPGIYLTTSWSRARLYAMGGGAVYRMELDPALGWLEEARLPLPATTVWIRGLSRLRDREDILHTLERGAARAGGPFPASLLVNAFVKADVASGQHGPALAAFLSRRGIDASLKHKEGEDWVVLFNPAKVQKVERLSPKQVDAPGFAFDLPRVKP